MRSSDLHPARLLGLALLLAAFGAPLPAQEGYSDSARRLDQVQQRIQRISEALEEERRRAADLRSELAAVEQRLGDVADTLRRLESDIRGQRQQVEQLRRRMEARSADLERHRDFLARQVRAAHRAGRTEYLRMVLSQEDPARLDRLLVYYQYLSGARAERIRRAVAELETLRRLRRELDRELATLEELRGQQRERRAELDAAREQRAGLLAQLRERVADRDRELTELRGDADRLRGLVQDLRDALADIPDAPGGPLAFSERRGRLPWPLQGRVAAAFGSPRAGGIRWQGLLIEAPEGTPVQSVAAGRVVFADWLRGMGLLLIIDHGSGFMSLYGYNQSLYKEAGEWVEAGEEVAAVGASGGRARSGLYFEVRAAGQPQDPVAWLGAGRG